MRVSLDGFAAGQNGEMDWIHVDDEIFDYAGNMADQGSYWPTAGYKPKASKHEIQHSTWYNN